MIVPIPNDNESMPGRTSHGAGATQGFLLAVGGLPINSCRAVLRVVVPESLTGTKNVPAAVVGVVRLWPALLLPVSTEVVLPDSDAADLPVVGTGVVLPDSDAADLPVVGTEVVLTGSDAGELPVLLFFNGAGVTGTEPFTAAQQLSCKLALQVAAATPE